MPLGVAEAPVLKLGVTLCVCEGVHELVWLAVAVSDSVLVAVTDAEGVCEGEAESDEDEVLDCV